MISAGHPGILDLFRHRPHLSSVRSAELTRLAELGSDVFELLDSHPDLYFQR